MKENNKIEKDIWDLLNNPKKTDDILKNYSREELKFLKKSLLDIKSQANKSRPDFDKIWGEIQSSIPQKDNKFNNIFTPLKYAIAAVAVIIISFVTFHIIDNNAPLNNPKLANNFPLLKNEHDIAELTLSNGRKVDLSQMNKGVSIKDTDVDIVTNSKNSLTYQTKRSELRKLEYNIISVPKGGEYSITLSDGTDVRLNSQSSLRFPIHFIGNNRKVFLKGEAFFQVAENKSKPFIVEVNNMNVEVLGTVFNINSYPENKDIKTTLVNGSVKIINTKNTKQSITIKPNEQAVFNSNGIKKKRVNIKEFVSWVKGKFYFNDMTLESVMIQIERWYNVDVVFLDKKIKSFPFTGVINKSSSLEETMRIIEKVSKTKIEVKDKYVHIDK